MTKWLILAMSLSLFSLVNSATHNELESSFEVGQLIISGEEFNIKQIMQLGKDLKDNHQSKMEEECGKVGGTCSYWSDSSVAARQMTNLIDTNLAEITNFCSRNHPNTKDRVQMGELVDMENTIPGMRGMAKMINFKNWCNPRIG